MNDGKMRTNRRWSLGGAVRVVLGVAVVAGLFVGPGAVQAGGRDPDLKVPAPEFPAPLRWLNSEPLNLQKLKGKVVLIDFWEYTCVNCIRTFPYLKIWNERYKDQGLVIVGIHTPEFQFAKVEDNVKKAAKEFGLDYPHVVDSDYLVWRTYGNRFWPAKYLIDKDGFVRYAHFGEGAYDSTESKIQTLLKEINPNAKLPSIAPPVRGTDKRGAVCYPVTPEIYGGYERGGHENSLQNPEGYQPGKIVTYRDTARWIDGKINLNGRWRNEAEAMITVDSSTNPNTYLGLRYHALELNSVMKPEAGMPVKVWVHQNGKPLPQADKGEDIQYDSLGKSYFVVNEPRMYRIVKNSRFGHHNLKLSTGDAGLGIYSFTFVSCEVPR